MAGSLGIWEGRRANDAMKYLVLSNYVGFVVWVCISNLVPREKFCLNCLRFALPTEADPEDLRHWGSEALRRWYFQAQEGTSPWQSEIAKMFAVTEGFSDWTKDFDISDNGIDCLRQKKMIARLRNCGPKRIPGARQRISSVFCVPGKDIFGCHGMLFQKTALWCSMKICQWKCTRYRKA